jgi:tRNA (guanine-N7-)-methyltransferase
MSAKRAREGKPVRSQPKPAPPLKENEMPHKRFYRSRAHCNPLSHNDGFQYPVSATEMDWTSHYPQAGEKPVIDILDIGCGFGGLTVALSKVILSF